jgi:hypothetical protein
MRSGKQLAGWVGSIVELQKYALPAPGALVTENGFDVLRTLYA